jgi:hypothetical protein
MRGTETGKHTRLLFCEYESQWFREERVSYWEMRLTWLSCREGLGCRIAWDGVYGFLGLDLGVDSSAFQAFEYC